MKKFSDKRERLKQDLLDAKRKLEALERRRASEIGAIAMELGLGELEDDLIKAKFQAIHHELNSQHT